MTLNVRTSGGLKEIGSIFVRTSSGLKEIGEVWVRTAAGLKQIFGAFSAKAVPGILSGTGYSHSGIRVTTSGWTTVTLSPSDMTGATIVWSSPDPGWDAVNPGSFTTAFRSPVLGLATEATTTFQGTVTKGSDTADVFVSVSCSNDFGV